MKKYLLFCSMLVLVGLLFACEQQEKNIIKDHAVKQITIKEKEPIKVEQDPPVKKLVQKEVNVLDGFSDEKIEYARVWLQVIGNTETSEINVHYIKAGDPVNAYDEQSANYPEDVIYLSGEFMASGNIVYSGNGDGTINIYDVPSHWQEGI